MKKLNWKYCECGCKGYRLEVGSFTFEQTYGRLYGIGYNDIKSTRNDDKLIIEYLHNIMMH